MHGPMNVKNILPLIKKISKLKVAITEMYLRIRWEMVADLFGVCGTHFRNYCSRPKCIFVYACGLLPELSVVFCLTRAVHKFDLMDDGHVTNEDQREVG